DLAQIAGDRDVQGRILHRFAGLFKTRNSEFSALQFMPLPFLRFERLGGGGVAEFAPAPAADIPFDEVAPFRQRCSIGIAFIISRNGREFPARGDLDAPSPAPNLSSCVPWGRRTTPGRQPMSASIPT